MPHPRLVFVVDDDPSVLRAFSRLVRSLGYRCKTFTDGQQLLDLYKTEMADCIVLDIQMAGKDGIAVRKELVARGQSIPTIFISASADAKVEEDAWATNPVAFLRKPCPRKKLSESIKKALASVEPPSP